MLNIPLCHLQEDLTCDEQASGAAPTHEQLVSAAIQSPTPGPHDVVAVSAGALTSVPHTSQVSCPLNALKFTFEHCLCNAVTVHASPSCLLIQLAAWFQFGSRQLVVAVLSSFGSMHQAADCIKGSAEVIQAWTE